MLEDLAYSYYALPTYAASAISFAWMVLGGLIGGRTAGSDLELGRGAYFAWWGLIVLGLSALTLALVPLQVPLMSRGFFWVRALIDILTLVALGFAIARIAVARSRDAYGHGRAAPLAFIPVAFLWLYLKGSRDPGDDSPLRASRANATLTGVAGVIVGLIAAGAGAGLDYLSNDILIRQIDRAAADGTFATIDLTRQLQSMVETLELPVPMSDIVTLVRIEADGTTLRQYLDVNLPDMTELAEADRTTLLASYCQEDWMLGIIDAGGTIESIYSHAGGAEIGRLTLTADQCGT